MREIKLSHGLSAIVDSDLYGELSAHKWYPEKHGSTYRATRYIRTSEREKYNDKTHLLMHHAVLGDPPSGMVTDHINGNGLDNRRANLRHISQRENLQNRTEKNKSSQYPGVYKHKKYNLWQAYINVNKERILLGSHKTEMDAWKAYRDAATKYGIPILGDFA